VIGLKKNGLKKCGLKKFASMAEAPKTKKPDPISWNQAFEIR
jgi:hypothetical protein